MRKGICRVIAAVAVLGLTSAGCYHVTVITGRPPNGHVVEHRWVHGYVHGLVPRPAVDVASECPAGVARVDTSQSFWNGVASLVTFGLYSPMTVSVACAADTSAALDADADVVVLGENTTPAEFAQALNAAAERSKESGAPVYLTLSGTR